MMKAAVIGLGKIGFEYDLNTDFILTHTKAFESHPEFELVGAVNPGDEARKSFESVYSKPSFRSISELFEKTEPEIVSICSPTETHFEVIQEVLKYSPQMILAEKPLTTSSKQALEIAKACEKSQTKLLINYMRRADPEIIEFQKKLLSGQLGEIQSVFMKYTGTLLNTGSHFIDLFQFLFGKIKDAAKVKEDLFEFSFEKTKTLFHQINGLDYALNEFEVIGQNGVFQFFQNGNTVGYRNLKKNPVFSNHQILDLPQYKSTQMSQNLKLVLDQVILAHTQKKHTLCTPVEAAETLKWIEKL